MPGSRAPPERGSTVAPARARCRRPRRFRRGVDGHGFIESTNQTFSEGEPMATTPLQQLAEHGQSVWIDFLSRTFIHDGDLAGLIREGVVGATSNPTIFQGAIAEGDAYDDQIRELVGAGTSEPKDIFLEL